MGLKQKKKKRKSNVQVIKKKTAQYCKIFLHMDYLREISSRFIKAPLLQALKQIINNV